MAFWSDTTLRSKLGSVIDPPVQSQVDTSGYRLRVGAEAFVTGESPKDGRTSYTLKEGDCLQIPPGQFALIQTEEKITIPRDALGLISMRSGKKFDGLINVSGFHVDPGFSGRLLFSVFNAGPNTISIRKGEKTFMIWFAYLDQPNGELYGKGIDNDHINPSLIDKLNQKVDSLPEVNKKVNQLLETKKAIRWGIWPVAGLIITISAPFYLSWNSRLTDLEANNQYLTSELRRQEVEIVQPINVTPASGSLQNILTVVQEITTAQEEEAERIGEIQNRITGAAGVENSLEEISTLIQEERQLREQLEAQIQNVSLQLNQILAQPSDGADALPNN